MTALMSEFRLLEDTLRVDLVTQVRLTDVSGVHSVRERGEGRSEKRPLYVPDDLTFQLDVMAYRGNLCFVDGIFSTSYHIKSPVFGEDLTECWRLSITNTTLKSVNWR